MGRKHYDIIIVGAGCAGMTAAIYARRAGKSVLLLEKETFGGQIAFTSSIENFPGFGSVSGLDFADRMLTQVTDLGADAELETVTAIALEGDKKIVTTDYNEYECCAVIICAGLKHRTLGLERESDYIGHGVSFCAVCDGDFYKYRDVAVCGGGNTALSDALLLSDICGKVSIIHRRDTFRGDVALVERLRAKSNVDFIMNSTVSELHGGDGLTGLTVENAVSGAKSELAVDALFVAVGREPQTALLEGLLPRDEKGYIIADESCLTPASGVFVAGDCRTKEVRQLTTAAADGAVAALAACRYIDSL